MSASLKKTGVDFVEEQAEKAPRRKCRVRVMVSLRRSTVTGNSWLGQNWRVFFVAMNCDAVSSMRREVWQGE